MKRLTAILLVICMMFTMVPSMAYADIDLKDDLSSYEEGLCEHHPVHEENCGYEPSSEKDPCSHIEDGEHDDSCYELICGYEEGEIEEDRIATNTDASEPHRHDDSCYELICQHMDGEHDRTCGYVTAEEGRPCTFVCEVCSVKDRGDTATPSDALFAKTRTAGNSVYVGGVTLSGSTDSPAYATTDDSGTVTIGGDEDDYNIKWDGSTLTLKNSTIKEAKEYDEKNKEKISIYLDSGDLDIMLIGENIVDAMGEGTAASCGINLSNGSLTISGEDDASLSVFGGTTTSGNSCGIYAIGMITIDSGTLTVKGESAAGNSYGIASIQSFTVNGGTVTAEGGDASLDSHGIYTTNLTVNDGVLTATAGNADREYSMGVYAHGGSINISGGTVTTKGGIAAELSYGMYSDAGFTINGGIISAESSYAGLSYGIRCGGDFLITDGNLTATSGKTYQDCVGIYSKYDVTIKGGAVTAKGWESVGEGAYNFGIRSHFGSILIEDGTVNATGGTAHGTLDNHSSGLFAREGSITVSGGTVTATGREATGTGVNYSTGFYARDSVTISGGTVTATGGPVTDTGGTAGNGGSYGIFVVNTGTPGDVTINGNSVIRANMTGEKGVDGEPISGETIKKECGIVFENGVGTVYGDVILQEDLEISEGESLTIPDGSSLTIPDGKTLIVNGGELTGNVPQSGVVYKVTEVKLSQAALTLNVGGSEELTAIIRPDIATDQNVIWSSDKSNIVTITPDENDSKTAMITAVGTGSVNITATVDGRSASCSVTVFADPAAGNKADVDAAKTTIERHTWTVPQATANTEEAVKAWIEGRLADMNLNGVSYTVTMTSFTAAVKGISADRDGTDGSFAFTVDLSKGTAAGDAITNTYAESVAFVSGGVIAATAYESSGNSYSGGSYTGPVRIYYADGSTIEIPSDATQGTWEQETASDGTIRWRFRLTDGSYAAGRWIKALYNGRYLWYRTDSDGYLLGGWFTETDGNIYYLHPLHDGAFGYMYTGDYVIDGRPYSFSIGREQDSLPEGALKR